MIIISSTVTQNDELTHVDEKRVHLLSPPRNHLIAVGLDCLCHSFPCLLFLISRVRVPSAFQYLLGNLSSGER